MKEMRNSIYEPIYILDSDTLLHVMANTSFLTKYMLLIGPSNLLFSWLMPIYKFKYSITLHLIDN